MSRVSRRLRGLVGLAAAVATVVPAAVAAPAWAAAPRPVYAPNGANGQPNSAADPGVVRAGGDFLAFTTGSLAPVARGDYASGPWRHVGPALSRLGAWSSGGAVWAPDAVQTSAGWVLYYSAPAKGMNGQRCIGVATSSSVTGPYTPFDTPLVCPNAALGGDDLVPGRPVASAGVIDPSPFQDTNGYRFLLYKTQKTPSTLRMVRLGSSGLHAVKDSGELHRSSGIIENPVMVRRGDYYVLFASRYGYNNCSYATVWFRATNRWAFADKTSHTLMNTSGTGICGPGGADIVPALDGGTRIFLHGWRCTYPTGTRNCASSSDVGTYPSRRAMYVGVLGWGTDGATPRVAKFLAPGE